MTTPRNYDVIVAPVITEKATRVSEHGQVVFKVRLDASKAEIKDAVQNIFDVKVTAVNTVNQVGKRKRLGRAIGFTKGYKKAIVTLKPGYKIDVL